MASADPDQSDSGSVASLEAAPPTPVRVRVGGKQTAQVNRRSSIKGKSKANLAQDGGAADGLAPGSPHGQAATAPGIGKARKAKSLKSKHAGGTAASADAKARLASHAELLPAEVLQAAHEKCQRLATAFRGKCFMMEIFAGCMHLSGAAAEVGLNLCVPIDFDMGRRPWADVNNKDVMAFILCALECGLVWYVHLATECRLWSVARTTGRAICDTGPIDFTARVLQTIYEFNTRAAANLGASVASPWQPMVSLIRVSIENPVVSQLFSVTRIEKYVRLLRLERVLYDCCCYGASYRKTTQLRCNLPSLHVLGATRCKDLPRHQHTVLEGVVRVWLDGKYQNVWRTRLAAAYVPDLSRAWVRALQKHAPVGAFAEAGTPVMHSDWQRALMDLSGAADAALLPMPSCPATFVSPGAGAESTWSWKGKRGARKRPACSGGQ